MNPNTEPLESVNCHRCGVGTEQYMTYQTIHEKMYVCDECCRKFVSQQLGYYLSIKDFNNFVERKND